MKLVTIVGIRGSGKTTIVENLTRALTARGCRVGTVKSVFCPTFHMDQAGSNTMRHRLSGAQIVCARAAHETDLLYSTPLKTSEILRHYGDCDWVLLEGDYAIPCTRIVAAHEENDAVSRINPLTVALSGRIAGSMKALHGLPVYHPEKDREAFLDFLLQTVPDCTDLASMDQDLKGEDLSSARAFCAAGCHGHKKREKKESGILLMVDGERVSLTPQQQALIRSWAQPAPDPVGQECL